MTTAPQPAPVAPPTPPARPPVRVTLVALALMLAAGVGLGLLCHWIGLDRPDGMLFKFLIALPLSLVGVVLVHGFGLGRRPALVLAGLGAVTTFLSSHYLQYRDFPGMVERPLRDVLEARAIRQRSADLAESVRALEEQAAQLPPERRAKYEPRLAKYRDDLRSREPLEAYADRLADPEKEREMGPILRRFDGELADVRARIAAGKGEDLALGRDYDGKESVTEPWAGTLGFRDYLDLRAEQGVRFNLVEGKRLGYTSSYLFWVAEVVVAGLIAGWIMAKTAADKDVEKDAKELFAPSPPPGRSNP